MNPDKEFAYVLEGQYPRPWIILPGHTYGGEVGTFSADFVLYNRGRSSSMPFTGTVDTGAAYTVVPRTFLEELGIEEDYTEPFILADGSRVELAVGRAEMELEGRIRDIYVVFGPDDETVLIGAMSLEAFALAADARNGRLIPGRLTLLVTPRPSSN